MFEVYYLTSPSGRGYVGFTSVGADKRWLVHVKDAKRGSKFPLHNAIRKYGPKSFSRSLLERMTTEAGAKRAEQLWIKELGTFGPGGYNATLGGEGTLGLVHSPETRAKIAESQFGNKKSPETRAKMSKSQTLRAPPSLETRAKIGESSRGKKKSPATCAKIGESKRGKKRSPVAIAKTASLNRGKKRSPETRAKMAESQRGKKLSPETRAKISASLTGKRGRKHSLETIANAQD